MRARLDDHTRVQSYSVLPARVRSGIPDGVRLIGAPVMWARGITGAGVVIGTIDSGVDAQHPDLQRTPDGRPKILSFRDYTRGNSVPQPGAAAYDDNGHGTHVAGTIAAAGQIRGVAPGAQLRVYKVLGSDGTGTYEAVTQAIRDAIADGCHVISMSLGAAERVLAWRDAMRAAVAAERVVTVSAGNAGPGSIRYPAYEDEPVTVGALGYDPVTGRVGVTWFSTQNDQVDGAAHGEGVISTAAGGGYTEMSGTSMAQPHVAGMAALLIEAGQMALGRPLTERGIWEGIAGRTLPIPDHARRAVGGGMFSFLPAWPRRTTVEMVIGEKCRWVNGERQELDVAPITVQVPGGERTLIPPRHSHAPMGDQVDWDGQQRRVTLTRWHLPGVEV